MPMGNSTPNTRRNVIRGIVALIIILIILLCLRLCKHDKEEVPIPLRRLLSRKTLSNKTRQRFRRFQQKHGRRFQNQRGKER